MSTNGKPLRATSLREYAALVLAAKPGYGLAVILPGSGGPRFEKDSPQYVQKRSIRKRRPSSRIYAGGGSRRRRSRGICAGERSRRPDANVRTSAQSHAYPEFGDTDRRSGDHDVGRAGPRAPTAPAVHRLDHHRHCRGDASSQGQEDN